MNPSTRALAYQVGDLIRDASTRHGAILDSDLEGDHARELAVDASWLLSVVGQLHAAAAAFESALRAESDSPPTSPPIVGLPHPLDVVGDEHPDDYEPEVDAGWQPVPFEGSTIEPCDAPWTWPIPPGGGR